MTNNVLSRLSYINSAPLSSFQAHVDAMVSGFTEQATDWRSLAAMAAGGLFYRLGRAGTLFFGTRVGVAAPAFRLASYAVGLGAEVIAFEGVNRLIATASGDQSNPNLWRLDGRGGIKEGLSTSLVTFGMLKMGGYAAREQNFLLQQLVSNFAMVGGHQITGALGWTPRPEGTLEEQLVHAAITNFQMGAGMSLMHTVAPGIASLESTLDLSLKIHELSLRSGQRGGPLLQQPALAMATLGEGVIEESPVPLKNISHVHMNAMVERGGVPSNKEEGGKFSEKTAEPFSPADFEAARQALYRLSQGEAKTPDETVSMVEALRFARTHPEVMREALIGRDDLPPQQLDALYQILKPAGLEIRTTPHLKRTLITNRGEIALRIARGLVEQGITPIVTYAESDAKQSFVRRAREMGAEVVNIGGKTAEESYLRQEHLIEVAAQVKADSIHPGYGFISENAAFAQRIHDAGLILMGPSVETMRQAGGKSTAKEAFENADVPVVRGTKPHTELESLMAAIESRGLRYPIRLKAEEGGSGMGQATVYTPAEARTRFPILSVQAQKSFGNSAILAEEYVPSFHHVEFQIVADRFGNVVHLGERECTLQNEGAKVVEIHPAAVFDRIPGLREKMQEAAIKAAQSVNYTGHGTVEFMVNPQTGVFYALEVNARIQVEHRVTELVTGVDILHEQVRISRGLPLSIRQRDVKTRGAAVEVRVTVSGVAPIKNFTVLGTSDFATLQAEGIYIEPTYLAGDTPNPNMNALLAKIIVTGPNRRVAMERMGEVLRKTRIEGERGFKTDLERNLKLVQTQAALNADYDNTFVKKWTHLGGEDLSRLPHRVSLMLGSPEGTPLYLEVGSRQAFERERAEEVQESLHRLLKGEESEENRLQGPLAEFLRQNSDARHALGYTQPKGEEGLPPTVRAIPPLKNKSVWAQADASGHLRQVVLFENHRPRRVFLSHHAPVSIRGKEAAETWGAKETSLVYDIHFSASGNNLEQARAFAVRNDTFNPLVKINPTSPYFHRSPDGREMNLFLDQQGTGAKRSPATSQLPIYLNVKLIPSRSQTVMEIRDRNGAILVSVSSDQAMESPGQQMIALYELTGRQSAPHLQQKAVEQIRRLIGTLAELPVDHPIRRQSIQEIGSTPISMTSNLLDLIRESSNPSERALLGEMMAVREIEGFSRYHELTDYTVLNPIPSNTPQLRQATDPQDPPPSLARYKETKNGQSLNRSMIRSRAASSVDYLGTLREAAAHLQEVQKGSDPTRDNVIQVVVKRPEPKDLEQAMIQLRRMQVETGEKGESALHRLVQHALKNASLELNPVDFASDQAYAEFLQLSLHLALKGHEGLNLKRVTFVVDRPNDYPRFFTFRPELTSEGQATGSFVEDTRLRDVHPMRAHQIEMRSMDHFHIQRDLEHSDHSSHLYYGRNKATKTLKEGEDVRLFGNALIPFTSVHGNEALEIPEVEEGFVRLMDSMSRSMESRKKDNKPPRWNRMFLNIQPILDLSESEATDYAKRLAERHHNRLMGLHLEQVVVKARLRDRESPGGYRTVLIQVTNPTGYDYEPVLKSPVYAKVRHGDGKLETREVFIENGTYRNWALDPETPIEAGKWSPADYTVKPATPIEIREQKARIRGATWAYRIPDLMDQRAQAFRVKQGLEERPVEGSGSFPSHQKSQWTELDLDLQTARIDPRTGLLDYNYGELKPATDAQNRPRAVGQNDAGVVIGLRTDDLGIGMPVKRVVIMGDLTFDKGEKAARFGSLGPNECARINGAIRLAAKEGIPVDWYPASSGADIHGIRGVENLDATASTVREIVQLAQRHGIPINVVVDEVNIGAQSYWNSLSTIIQEAGGVLIMTKRGTQSLTGHVALTSAVFPTATGHELRERAKGLLPGREHSLAGHSEIHGPNAEAMAYAENLATGMDLLNLHHYYTYAERGKLVAKRRLGTEDPSTRDITLDPSNGDRTVRDEISAIAQGTTKNPKTILNALRDRGSPPPVFWWEDKKNLPNQPYFLQGMKYPEPSVIVADMQIGGRPTRVIFHQSSLTPIDSDIFSRALRKASGRMPVVILGSLPAFHADPTSMRLQQLRFGGEIAAAISRHEGPITLVNMGRLIGGAYVVFSKQVRSLENQELHRMIAVEGTFAQVLGGMGASKVVFDSRIARIAESFYQTVEKEIKSGKGPQEEEAYLKNIQEALVKKLEEDINKRLKELETSMAKGGPLSDSQRASMSRAEAGMKNELQRFADASKRVNAKELRAAVNLTLQTFSAIEFDTHHSVERAVQVGSFDEVISSSQVRETIIRHQEEAISLYESRQTKSTQSDGKP